MTNIQKGSTSDLTFNFDQIENISAKPTNTNVLRQNLFLYARVFGEKKKPKKQFVLNTMASNHLTIGLLNFSENHV